MPLLLLLSIAAPVPHFLCYLVGIFGCDRKKYGAQLTSSSANTVANGSLAVVSQTEVLRPRKDSIVMIQEFIQPVLPSTAIAINNPDRVQLCESSALFTFLLH